MDQAAKDQPQVRRVGRPPKVVAPAAMAVAENNEAAQSLASRIWEGQSPDLPRAERIHRVKVGLERQGLSMEGVTL